MSEKKAPDLMAKFLRLARRPGLNFFDLARLIIKLHVVDPSCVQDIADKTGISKRRLYYFIDVGRLLDAHNIGRTDAETVGWTKLQIIARHMKTKGGASAEEISKALKSANNSTALMLKREFREFRPFKMDAVVFQLGLEDRKEVEEALVAFGAKKTYRGLGEKELALIRVVRASMLQRG